MAKIYSKIRRKKFKVVDDVVTIAGHQFHYRTMEKITPKIRSAKIVFTKPPDVNDIIQIGGTIFRCIKTPKKLSKPFWLLIRSRV